ncbi:restriction endonuclease [Streptomyces sp. NPDC056683]|uniref:nSTAND3 domain-containing NTPase n=1 Tax=Streptomyces sp. NPDC056683 TaxID=3345910 RepID=UPI00368B12C6
MTRNYGNLSPYDFEILVRDLLQAELGERLETFPPGPDGGVDVRLFKDGSERLIVQCKHTPGKRYPEVKTQLKTEAAKVANRFRGSRYMLVTSASLTLANKRDIVKIFKNTPLSESDIWGVDDLENYIGLHPEIEQRNFKLWLTSVAVMARLLHNEIHERSAGLFEDIAQKARIYVQSDAYAVARNILCDNSVCLISGEPGIGKSSLAEMLLLKAIDEDWNVYRISEDVGEIDKVWNAEDRQVFYYDDFLGQNSLADKLNKNEDSRIAQVISRIQRSHTKRLVMTTREYILRHATQVYEPLRRNKFMTDEKLILRLAHYTENQKAHILYNHIYFSEASLAARTSILEGKVYREIVHHPNYNPRLIELITATYDDDSQISLAEYMRQALEDPSHLWEVIFEDQLTDTERNVLLILATFTHPVSVQDLERATRGYEKSSGQTESTKRSFMQSLKRLQGTFLTIDTARPPSTAGHAVTLVRLANPSFNDYVCQYLISRMQEIESLIDGACFFEQLTTLWSWHNGSYAQIQDLTVSVLTGTPKRKRRGATYMLFGFVEQFTQALIRTVNMQPAEWTRRRLEDDTGPIEADCTSRFIRMLRMNQDAENRLLATDVVDFLCDESQAILVREGVRVEDIGKFGTILSLIAATSKCTRDLTEFINMAYRIASMRGEEPVDYENRWILLNVPGASAKLDYEEEKSALVEKFISFAADWDGYKSQDAESAHECEEALGELYGAAETLGVEDLLDTCSLNDALEHWTDKESDDAGEYYAEHYRDEEFTSAEPSSSPLTIEILSRDPRSEIDHLFETLIE